MRKPIDEKTPLAAWATLARAEAAMSPEEVVDALAERGHAVKAATIRGIEGGSKQGSARLIRLMAEVYGKPTPLKVALEPVPTNDTAAIVAAIDRLTAAVEEQSRQFATLAGSAGTGLADLVLRLVEDRSRARDGSADQHQGANR